MAYWRLEYSRLTAPLQSTAAAIFDRKGKGRKRLSGSVGPWGNPWEGENVASRS